MCVPPRLLLTVWPPVYYTVLCASCVQSPGLTSITVVSVSFCRTRLRMLLLPLLVKTLFLVRCFFFLLISLCFVLYFVSVLTLLPAATRCFTSVFNLFVVLPVPMFTDVNEFFFSCRKTDCVHYQTTASSHLLPLLK